MFGHLICIFFIGLVYEALCVGFVHYIESNKKFKGLIVTMLAGILQVAGIFSAIKNIPYACALILGYGVGFYIGMILKNKS